MRRVTGIVAVLAVLMGAAPAIAQQHDDSDSSRKVTKILIGAGAVAIGTAVAAKSSKTTTVTSAIGTSETSTFSKSQLVTGLAVAGVGGIVLWDGVRSHSPNLPQTTVGVAVDRRWQSLFVRRTW